MEQWAKGKKSLIEFVVRSRAIWKIERFPKNRRRWLGVEGNKGIDRETPKESTMFKPVHKKIGKHGGRLFLDLESFSSVFLWGKS